MKKTTQSISLLTMLAFFLVAIPYADAQSDAAKKALENVKESVSSLVEAKDENDANETALRIETFKKVLEFSIEEARDLKLKLLSLDKTTTSSVSEWKDNSVAALNSFIAYYEAEQKTVKTEKMSSEDIKNRAEAFKEKRDNEFVPLSDSIQSFLAIEQGKKAFIMAENRIGKIEDDITKLKKVKFDTKKLEEMFLSAKKLVKDSDEINKVSEKRFLSEMVLPSASTSTAPTTTSSISISTSTASSSEPVSTTTIKNKIPESESEDAEPILQTSIKDLARDSLFKIRDAYQIFIEMSNLVRKLLK